MADITMCTTKDCPKEKECYRKTAKPSERQSMADFKCNEMYEHFYPIEKVSDGNP